MELPIFTRDDMTPREQLNDLIERIAVLQKYQVDMALINSLDAQKIEEMKAICAERERKLTEASRREDELLKQFPAAIARWESELK